MPEIKCIKDEQERALFVVEPLQPGFGITVGNSLRRTLLSSLPGAAVTSVKIAGANHEFSTIPHVKEDIIEVILNLKKLRLKKHNEDPITLKLNHKKPGPVTADLFSKNADVEIMNPDLVIATIDDKKGKIDLEITVESGYGYNPVEEREVEKREIGQIAVDALYNPVIQVSYNVENTRVGDQTNLDKLTLEVVTDGTVPAAETLDYAARILVNHFALFTTEGIEESAAKAAAKEADETTADIGKIKVEEINLSTRTLNALLKNNIKTINDVFKHYEDLPAMPGLGARAVNEVKEAIQRLEEESQNTPEK